MDSQVVLQLAKSRDGLVFAKPIISRATKPGQLSKLIENVMKPVNRFKLVSDCLICKTEDSEEETNQKVLDLMGELEREIFLSGLAKDLIALYDGEYFNADVSIEQMKLNLAMVIGAPDAKDEEKRHLEEFNSMHRRTEIDETFTSFLNRLKTKAAELTADSYGQKLVEIQFERNLREMDQSALDFHTLDQTGDALLTKQAEMLDKMKMNRKKAVKVNSVLEETNLLESKLDDLKNELRQESDKRYEKLLEDLGAKLNQLNVSKTETKPPSKSSAPVETKSKAKATKPKKKKKFNKEDYCYVCGLRGHNDPDCKGRPDMVCILCDQPGHVASSRKFHGQPKN